MIRSPCVDCCRLDKASGTCEGCYRTLAEITVWAEADDDTKTLILAAAAQRRERLEIAAGRVCNCSDG